MDESRRCRVVTLAAVSSIETSSQGAARTKPWAGVSPGNRPGPNHGQQMGAPARIEAPRWNRDAELT